MAPSRLSRTPRPARAGLIAQNGLETAGRPDRSPGHPIQPEPALQKNRRGPATFSGQDLSHQRRVTPRPKPREVAPKRRQSLVIAQQKLVTAVAVEIHGWTSAQQVLVAPVAVGIHGWTSELARREHRQIVTNPFLPLSVENHQPASRLDGKTDADLLPTLAVEVTQREMGNQALGVEHMIVAPRPARRTIVPFHRGQLDKASAALAEIDRVSGC